MFWDRRLVSHDSLSFDDRVSGFEVVERIEARLWSWDDANSISTAGCDARQVHLACNGVDSVGVIEVLGDVV